MKFNSNNLDKTSSQIVDQIIVLFQELLTVHFKGLSEYHSLEIFSLSLMNYIMKRSLSQFIESNDAKECICKCGQKMSIKQKRLRNRVGFVHSEFKRRIFKCKSCKASEIPTDTILKVKGKFSLELRKIALYFGQMLPFEHASAGIKKVLEIDISHETIQELVEGVGHSLVDDDRLKLKNFSQETFQMSDQKNAIDDVVYLQMDGAMVSTREENWKEVKTGLIYKASERVQVNKHHKMLTKKKYFSIVNESKNSLDEFKKRTLYEVEKFGVKNYKNFVIVGDGAQWIWDYVDQVYPEAVQILDFYHASSYLGTSLKSLDKDKKEIDQLMGELKKGLIETIISYLEKQKQTDEVIKCMKYFRKNLSRMQYGEYIKQGFDIGSGAIESAHKIVVQSRMKQAGMRWNLKNVQSIVSLRCKYLTNDFEEIEDKYLNVG